MTDISLISSACLDLNVSSIDIESLQNRFIEVCYVPITSASRNRLHFFYFFDAAINSTKKQTRQAVHSIK